MNIDQNHIAELINQPLTAENLVQIQNFLSHLAPVEIGNLLTSTPAKERQQLWDLFDEDRQGEVVAYVDPDLVADLFSERSAEEIAQVIEKVADSDDLADIIQLMPDDLGEEILIVLDSQDQERVKTLLHYPRDSAGGLMDTDIISVRSEVSIDVVLRYLRRHETLPDATDQIFVVDKQGVYIGSLPLTTILVTDPRKLVSECFEQNIDGILADLPKHEVAQLFERYDLISMPVLDRAGLLLGRITIDDIVDVIIDEADHSILGMAGLNQIDDTLAPILKTSRNRALWLGANLMTAVIASFVINIFEDTIEKVVALAILMPIVASMGGVTGSQSLTLVIRSMAQGTLLESNMSWLIRRELAVSVLNGIIWASLIAVGTALLFNDATLAMIIAIALVINMAVAAVSGAMLPKILKSLNIDPAIAGTVVLTTITDVVGFLTFLGMATYFYA